ncbi:MAG: hypothetical protein AB7U95_13285 [Reyranella sp.]
MLKLLERETMAVTDLAAARRFLAMPDSAQDTAVVTFLEGLAGITAELAQWT